MNYYVLLTALTVSVDSFVCGFSLSLGKDKRFALVLIITLTVYCMCLLTNYSVNLFRNVFSEKTAGLGGLILIAVGLFNLIKKDTQTTSEKKGFITQSIMAGFAVGLDGAFGNLSLSIMGYNQFYVPLTIALTHGVMIFLSVVLAQSPIFNKVKQFSFIAPILLILLGLYKIITIF